jgi:single-stranded-DNA-specific exonuclease
VGLVFKAAHALLKRRPLPGLDLRQHLDYVALGTVADLVPLTGENRALVKRGLAQIGDSRWPGIRALLRVAAVCAPVSAGDVGFKLGPRMNAAGRLGTARDALDLLLADDPAVAAPLAESLDAQNRDRRAVEDAVYLEAEAQLLECFVAERDAAIVVGAPGWHPGVIGIVASRLMKRHHRPTLVIGFDEHGLGKGSGRSIDGLSLVEALGDCSRLLERHGGHEMAAGLTIRHDYLAELRELFRAAARRRLREEDLLPKLELDAEITLREVRLPLLEHYESLQPFGMANSRPNFFARRVTLAAEPFVMKEKHLSLMLLQGASQARAVWFGAAQEELPPPPWDIAFNLERNEYQGLVTPQIHIRAIRGTDLT